MEKTLRWLNLILICITLTSYLSPFVDPSVFWPFSFFGMAYPWLLLFNVLFAITWIILKNWYFLFSATCILLGWNHLQSFIGFHAATVPDKKDLMVMTFNSAGYQQVHGKREKAFAALLQKERPDIICIQEAFTDLNLIDKKTFPYSYQPKNKYLIIHSKFPFVHQENMNIGNTANGCIFADIKIKEKVIRVYNVHLQSNKVTQDASKLSKEGDLQEKETWLGIKGMLGKVKRAAQIRSHQAKLINRHIAQSQVPTVVCGDLNDTPLSFTYQLFSKNLRDGFKERASGLGTTYGGKIPALRIDYIFTSPEIAVHSHQIIKEKFSDHYPVFSRIHL